MTIGPPIIDTQVMTPSLAGLSRTIDPSELGRRIRDARVAAGMTQAQVANGEVTTAYISRIEDGQRRPALHLLERMAARMETSLHQLLTGASTAEVRQLELEVEHAAVALGFGRAEEALAVATAASVRCEAFGDPALLAEALRVKAEAQLATGDLAQAVASLEALTEHLVPDMNTLRALISLCRCYCETDQLSRAVAVGELAERMATRLEISGLAETARLAAVRADALLRRGDHDGAAEVSRVALDAASTGPHSTLDQAASYWRASLSESSANGPTPAAIELAKVALSLVDIEAHRKTVDHLTRLATD